MKVFFSGSMQGQNTKEGERQMDNLFALSYLTCMYHYVSMSKMSSDYFSCGCVQPLQLEIYAIKCKKNTTVDGFLSHYKWNNALKTRSYFFRHSVDCFISTQVQIKKIVLVACSSGTSNKRHNSVGSKAAVKAFEIPTFWTSPSFIK